MLTGLNKQKPFIWDKPFPVAIPIADRFYLTSEAVSYFHITLLHETVAINFEIFLLSFFNYMKQNYQYATYHSIIRTVNVFKIACEITVWLLLTLAEECKYILLWVCSKSETLTQYCAAIARLENIRNHFLYLCVWKLFLQLWFWLSIAWFPSHSCLSPVQNHCIS